MRFTLHQCSIGEEKKDSKCVFALASGLFFSSSQTYSRQRSFFCEKFCVVETGTEKKPEAHFQALHTVSGNECDIATFPFLSLIRIVGWKSCFSLHIHRMCTLCNESKRKEKCQNLNPTAAGWLSHETDYSSSSGYAGIHCYTFVHLHRFIGVVALWLRTELCLHVLACILNERETCWNAHKFSNQSSNETLHRSNAIGSCAVAATLIHHSHNFARSRFKPTASNRNRSLCFSVLIYTIVL